MLPAGPDSASAAPRAANWVAPWAGVTLTAAFAATAFDALLLQYRRSYFTGGFLANDYVTSSSEALAFFAGSLCTDAAAAGVAAFAALWLLGRLAVPRHLALAAALLLALAPVLVANFIEYQLLTYLGDAFDLRLLFDLAGRSPGEFMAVSSSHVARAIWMVAGVGLVAAAVFWIALRRLVKRTAAPVPAPATWRSALLPLAVCLVGAIVMTFLRSGSDVLDNGLRRKPTGRLLGSVVQAVTDLDRDGYGALSRPADPDLFDRDVRPYALDLPGNGIDEDGVGGDLPSAVEPYREAPAASGAWGSKPDIVLIVLESFRADLRGARLGGKSVTPVLDALAERGIAPRVAYSHNGYTVQWRRHIFTGSVADIRSGTLVDDFKRQGYEVAYFSGQDESFGGPGQGVGFDRADVAYDARSDRERRYSSFSTAGSLAVPYDVVRERVGAFLDTRQKDRPLFLYVNFHDTHFPYHHRGIQPLISDVVVAQSDIGPDRADDVRTMYMNTASNVDRAIGDVLDDVRRTLGHEPGVIVMSDHGESLFDEGFLGHGYTLNDAQTRIPLVVAGLRLTIEEPFVQADLRDAIGRALEQPGAAGAGPVLAARPSPRVFQYLGLLERPAQIAWTGLSDRVTYDFRENSVRVGHGQWRRPEQLTEAEHADFLSLIQAWERMMLARHDVATAPRQGL
jgi:glucan phosphoethanolaminetransferase (alkaline phosphatase superfamily)